MSVRGTGFITKEGLACRFGGLVVSGAGARLETSTVVACIAPKPREEGAVAVEISLNGGVDYTSSGKQFVYQSNPTVDSLEPAWAVAGEEPGDYRGRTAFQECPRFELPDGR